MTVLRLQSDGRITEAAYNKMAKPPLVHGRGFVIHFFVKKSLQLQQGMSTNFTSYKVGRHSNYSGTPTYIAATLGEQHFGLYIGVAFMRGCFVTQTVRLGPECLAFISQLAFIQGWPLRLHCIPHD